MRERRREADNKPKRAECVDLHKPNSVSASCQQRHEQRQSEMVCIRPARRADMDLVRTPSCWGKAAQNPRGKKRNKRKAAGKKFRRMSGSLNHGVRTSRHPFCPSKVGDSNVK